MAEQREADKIEQSRYEQIVIVSDGGKWLVKYKDQQRVCADRASARKIAIQLAHESGEGGNPARVMLHRRDSKMVAIWVYGRDEPPDQTNEAAG